MAQQSSPTEIAATEAARGSLGGLILLGTFGTRERPRALVRTSGGKVVTLKIGDRIGRAPIIAIEDGRLAYAPNGTTRWLQQPVAH